MKEIGRYQIIEELGVGGMGVVYKAKDPLMEREVAIKVLSRAAFMQEEIRKRFYREARSLGQLSHENITIVHDLGEVGGEPYIVMEFLGGTDLRSIIKSKTEISLQQKLDYARQICRGLEYSHAKDIIHRDIKPENIRVLDNHKIKIMDFGIARPLTSTMTQTGMLMGTPYYMSPEQIRGLKVGQQSDIFSFGVLLYELLTSTLPFPGEEPTTVIYKIVHEPPEPLTISEIATYPELHELVLKCLEKELDKRYASFGKVLVDLARITKNVETVQQTAKTDEHKQVNQLLDEFNFQLEKQNFAKAKTVAEKLAIAAPVEAEKRDLLTRVIEAEQKAANRRSVEQKVKSAEKSVREKQYAEAVTVLEEALALVPEHKKARSLLQLAATALSAEGVAQEEAATVVLNRQDTPVAPVKRSKGRSRIVPVAALAVVIGTALALYALFFLNREDSAIDTANGYLSLNILPWAEVVRISNNDGTDITAEFPASDLVTPTYLTLPAGKYVFAFKEPSSPDSLRIEVQIEQGKTSLINRKIRQYEYKGLLTQLGF
jgi:serine/threonine-protein kinase